MSGLDGSGAVHTVLTWEAFGGHVPPGGSEMYWFDQSYHARRFGGYNFFLLKISGGIFRSDFWERILETTLKVGRRMWFHISCPISGRTNMDGLKMKMAPRTSQWLQERAWIDPRRAFCGSIHLFYKCRRGVLPLPHDARFLCNPLLFKDFFECQ